MQKKGTACGAFFNGVAHAGAGGLQRPGPMPVGWMYPNFQAAKMQRNKATDSPTRAAKARAMWRDGLFRTCPPRIMKNKADARQARMPKNARATRYDMPGIIG